MCRRAEDEGRRRGTIPTPKASLARREISRGLINTVEENIERATLDCIIPGLDNSSRANTRFAIFDRIIRRAGVHFVRFFSLCVCTVIHFYLTCVHGEIQRSRWIFPSASPRLWRVRSVFIEMKNFASSDLGMRRWGIESKFSALVNMKKWKREKFCLMLFFQLFRCIDSKHLVLVMKSKDSGMKVSEYKNLV